MKMIRKRLFLPALTAIALCLSPAAGAAQSGGWTVGISGGPNVIREDERDYQALRPHIRAHLSRRLTEMLSVGIEAAAYGLFDETPNAGEVALSPMFPDSVFLNPAQVVGTQTLFATVEIDVGGGSYLRPGVGLGRHAFTVYEVGANNEVVDARISHETGIAWGVSGGQKVELGRVTVGIEAMVMRSQGEDSSNPRWIYGVSVGPRFTF